MKQGQTVSIWFSWGSEEVQKQTGYTQVQTGSRHVATKEKRHAASRPCVARRKLTARFASLVALKLVQDWIRLGSDNGQAGLRALERQEVLCLPHETSPVSKASKAQPASLERQ